jgi:hypothetical protein
MPHLNLVHNFYNYYAVLFFIVANINITHPVNYGKTKVLENTIVYRYLHLIQYAVQRVPFTVDPQLGSREQNINTAKNHLNHAPFGLGLRPLQPVVWGGIYCQMGINPKVTVI